MNNQYWVPIISAKEYNQKSIDTYIAENCINKDGIIEITEHHIDEMLKFYAVDTIDAVKLKEMYESIQR